MQETYCLTRFDYLHCRSWTMGFNEFNFDANGIRMTMRDVGGDELNREHHWAKSIKDSFCVLFVVSLCEYTRVEKDGRTAKFRKTRAMLWDYLIDEANPKIILLCNKQDLFREQLKKVPLHKGCKEFKDYAPQAEGEQFEAYCERCEKAVLHYFKRIPSSTKKCKKVKEREEAGGFDISDVHLRGAFLTQATDEKLFCEVKKKLTNIFSEFMNQCMASVGIN
jgi:hypothetical protein